MSISQELKALLEHFRDYSGMVDVSHLEEKHLPHQKRIDLGQMNQMALHRLSDYLYSNFPPNVGILGSYGNRLYLTLNTEDIRKYIMKKEEKV